MTTCWNNILGTLDKILLKLVWPPLFGFAVFNVTVRKLNVPCVAHTCGSHYTSIGPHCSELLSLKPELLTILCYPPKVKVYSTGISPFIILCFIALHRCFILLQTEGKNLQQQRDYDSLYCNTHFISVSGTEPTISPRYAWIHINKKVWPFIARWIIFVCEEMKA